MAKRKAGRPPTVSGKTRQVRMVVDVLDKLVWISTVEGRSVTQIVDQLVRDWTERRYKELYPQLKQLHAQQGPPKPECQPHAT
jgi:hypothetical protein